jgi:LacI family transcriptional regulator
MATPPESCGPEAPAPPRPARDGEPWPLSFFACPNPDCPSFNIFGAGNLSVAEHLGKNKAIRRLYCNVCQSRFSERQGSLLQDSKLPPTTVLRIVKCFGYGLPVAATADICEVDPRRAQRLLEKGGQRAQDFHPWQLAQAADGIEAVQLDEMHGHVAGDNGDAKKGARSRRPRRRPAARR